MADIVEAPRGTVEVESAAGVGTTVRVRLPRAPEVVGAGADRDEH